MRTSGISRYELSRVRDGGCIRILRSFDMDGLEIGKGECVEFVDLILVGNMSRQRWNGGSCQMTQGKCMNRDWRNAA